MIAGMDYLATIPLDPWKLDCSGASLGAAIFGATNNAVPPLSDVHPAGDGTAAEGGIGLEGSLIGSAATWAWLTRQAAGTSSVPYQATAVGNFNDDSSSDVLFLNDSTGDTDLYPISNGVAGGWHDIVSSATPYGVAAFGSENGAFAAPVSAAQTPQLEAVAETVTFAALGPQQQLIEPGAPNEDVAVSRGKSERGTSSARSDAAIAAFAPEMDPGGLLIQTSQFQITAGETAALLAGVRPSVPIVTSQVSDPYFITTGAVAPDVISLTGSNIVFHNTYGSGATTAYHQAVIDAEHFIEGHLTAGSTVDLYANFDFASLGQNFSGQSSFSLYTETYAAWRAQVAARWTSADDAAAVAALPTSDPTGGLGVSLPSGYARMMGMTVGNDLDSIVLNSDLSFNFANGDATGVLEHELSEGAMGRISSLGFRSFGNGTHFWNPDDFFRFTAGGIRDYTGGQDGVLTYFGFDATHVFTGFQYHNSINAQGQYDGFDLADWDHTVGDAFGPGGPGSPGIVSATDLRLMDVLGWRPITYTALVTQLYNDILGRAPDAGGLAVWTAALANGESLQNVRAAFAGSAEAQGDLTLTYNQELGRTPDVGGLASWTDYLTNGGSLQGVRTGVAHSGEAQGDLALIYTQELGRTPDAGGLAAWTDYLANGGSLQGVRTGVAHSGEAQGDLAAIFQNVEARTPDMAELAGMENQLVPSGATLSGVQAGLVANGPTGFTVMPVSSGDLILTALPTPEAFDFGSWHFGKDEITGFDRTQDAVRLNSGLVNSFATVQADMSAVAGGTLITFDSSHSLTLDGVAPAGLGAENFRFI
jgi:Domain of unknown function (DUF4214)